MLCNSTTGFVFCVYLTYSSPSVHAGLTSFLLKLHLNLMMHRVYDPLFELFQMITPLSPSQGNPLSPDGIVL